MAVILNTSLGDIVIDLHTDLCPLTSKNFLKLCKLKYYNNCLFYDVQKDFIAQTGDPTGTGSGGDSVYKHLYGDQARFFNDEFHTKLTHDKIGTVAMASAGENLNASQFYITLRAGLDYLDGKHTVFGEVAEGLETLMRMNEAFVDDKGRPFKNIRIKHVDILDDPFEDPPQLEDLIPDKSPEIRPPAEGEEVRLEDDWVPMSDTMDPEELDKSIRSKEAHSRAVVLEMIGDIPEAEVAPPENVLFVCKLNPVTEEEDLNTIFSRFGKVIAADIIRDYKTGESLCYGFIEFENKESCEAAYFKMDNVLIDDRRIHVDFSQSVARLWTRFRKIGSKDVGGQGAGFGQNKGKGGGCYNCGETGHLQKDCPHDGAPGDTEQEAAAPPEKPKYTLKDSAGQRGNPRGRYEMVFEETNEASDPDMVEAPPVSRASRFTTGRVSKRPSEGSDDGKRARLRFSSKDVLDHRIYHSRRNEGPKHRHADDRSDSDDNGRRRPGQPSPLRDRLDNRKENSGRNEGPKHRHTDDRSDSDDNGRRRSGQPSSLRDRPDDRSHHSGRNEGPKHRHADSRSDSDDNGRRRSGQPSSSRDAADDRRDHSRRSGRTTDRFLDERAARSSLLSRDRSDDRRDHSGRSAKPRERGGADRLDSAVENQKRTLSPLSVRQKQDGRRDGSLRSEHYRNKYREERPASEEGVQSPLPVRQQHHDRKDQLLRNDRQRYKEERSDSGDDRSGSPLRLRQQRHERKDQSLRKDHRRQSYKEERSDSDSDDDKQKRSGSPLRSRQKQDERRDRPARTDQRRERYAEERLDYDDVDGQLRAHSPLPGRQKQEGRRDHPVGKDRHRDRDMADRPDSDYEQPRRAQSPLPLRQKQEERRGRSARNGEHRERPLEERPKSDEIKQKRARSPSRLRQQDGKRERPLRNDQHREREMEGSDSDGYSPKRALSPVSVRQKQNDSRAQHRGKHMEESSDSDGIQQARPRPQSPASLRQQQDKRRDRPGRNDQHRERYAAEKHRSGEINGRSR